MGKHEKVETNVSLMIVLVIVAISFGTLVELVPLFFSKQTNEPIAGLKPLPALELEGRDIYIREGCNTCHSQMVRPLRAETERYGHYSVAGEFVYDHPFLWGSKRTGPDLARVGQRYSDDWHRAHLYNPRATKRVPILFLERRELPAWFRDRRGRWHGLLDRGVDRVCVVEDVLFLREFYLDFFRRFSTLRIMHLQGIHRVEFHAAFGAIHD